MGGIAYGVTHRHILKRSTIGIRNDAEAGEDFRAPNTVGKYRGNAEQVVSKCKKMDPVSLGKIKEADLMMKFKGVSLTPE